MQTRKASIKETGEELSATEWERFDAAVAQVRAERDRDRSAPADEAGRSPVRHDPHPVV